MKLNINLIEADQATKEEISKTMDNDIENFSKYMETISDFKSAGPLHPMEKMLIKTYLIWKYKEA